MELKKISFCNNFGYNVSSNLFKKKILDSLDNFHINIYQKHLKLFNVDKHSRLLKENPYVISLKSIGNNYLLYLTRLNGRNICLLIDKKILKGYQYPKIIFVFLRFNHKLFSNTLFNVELIKNNDESWQLSIIDILIYGNIDIRQKPLKYRNNKINEIITKNFIPDTSIEPFKISIKKYYSFNEEALKKLLELENKEYPTQGILFTSCKGSSNNFLLHSDNKFNHRLNNHITPQKNIYSQNTDTNDTFISHIKSKYQSNRVSSNDIILLIKNTLSQGIYELYCLKNKKITKYGIARIDSLEMSNILDKLDLTKSVFVKCEYNDIFDKWVPLNIVTNNTVDISDYHTLKNNEKTINPTNKFSGL
jgi:hypothetical protein